MPPKISVIMAVYNGEDFLRKSLKSLVDQTYQNFELILIDDASTDQTAKIISSFDDPRFVTLRNDQNFGLTNSLIKGQALASGEFIARQDADDLSLSKRFEKQVEALEAHPNLGLLGTSYHMVDKQDQILETSIQSGSNIELQELLEKKNIFCHGTIMCRKEIFDEVGGYRGDFSASQDYDLYLRMAEVGQIGILEEPLYLFRFHSESISRRKRTIQLANRYFAQDQALRRRSEKDELPSPLDMVAAYPPKPKDLFLDARGTSYLLFAAGIITEAAEALNRAYELSLEPPLNNNSWERWLLDRANAFASLRHDSNAGVEFLNWACSIIAERWENNQRLNVLQSFLINQAFLAYQDGNPDQVIANGVMAYRTKLSSIRNRGLAAIILKSLLQKATGN